jgi:hypothetical protein
VARVHGNISLAQVIGNAADRRANDLAVSLPGIVVSYNPATETATIKPGVSRLVPSVEDPDDDVVEELPAIHDVPVAWYRARGVSIVPPVGLTPGDPVTLLCMDRDISAWLRSGALSEPDDARSHSWANAIAIPGLVPSSNPFTAPVDAAALASKLDAIFQAISAIPPVPSVSPAVDGAPALVIANAILTAVRAVYLTVPPTPSVVSCASQILKVDL